MDETADDRRVLMAFLVCCTARLAVAGVRDNLSLVSLVRAIVAHAQYLWRNFGLEACVQQHRSPGTLPHTSVWRVHGLTPSYRAFRDELEAGTTILYLVRDASADIPLDGARIASEVTFGAPCRACVQPRGAHRVLLAGELPQSSNVNAQMFTKHVVAPLVAVPPTVSPAHSVFIRSTSPQRCLLRSHNTVLHRHSTASCSHKSSVRS